MIVIDTGDDQPTMPRGPVAAVRAVLALHVRMQTRTGTEPFCAECCQGWPCDTVTVIEEAMGPLLERM